VSAATVDVQNAESSPEDTAKAVVYTINKFSDSQGDDFTISSLSQGYDAMVRETISQISEFKHIIRDGNFQVALQPIVDLVTGQPHHYEALARFDEKIDSSPFRLISFAEEVGVIGEFDLAMARRAIDMLVRAQNGGRDLSIAINLSGRSLSSPSFIETLLGLLRDYGSLRRNLWLEITESARICDLEATNALIQNLRNAGHIVCLDDFGAGAAAFQYLRAMEVDVVKIDGVYVREALTAPHGRAFLKAMASLCKDLEIGVIAEMVEDKETAQFLRECGIRYGQGYLFGKPTFEITPGLQKAHNRLGRPERFHSAPAPKIAR
jgi:EAL domain-containing protein (putative c-di-GMP-specific phosphodiesterase class I)